VSTAWDRFAADWPESAALAQRQWDIARGLEQNEILILDEEYHCSDGTPAVIGFIDTDLILAVVAGTAEEAGAGMQPDRLAYLRAEACTWADRIRGTRGLQPGTVPYDVRRLLLGGRLDTLRVDVTYSDADHLMTWQRNVGGLVGLAS
jgi:hypothetical protein